MRANALFAVVATALACRNSAPEPAPVPLPPPSQAAQAAHPGALPAGHPPVGHGNSNAHPTAGEAPERPAGNTDLRWSDPVGWRRVQPSSRMRQAQYTVPGTGGAGDAEMAVFWFGTGQGGDIQANLDRWHGQFETPAGVTPPAVTVRTVNNLRVHITERQGRYSGAMGMPGGPAPSAHDDWAMLGAIVETGNSPWFFKLTGPRATVEAARRGFDDLVASFRTQ